MLNFDAQAFVDNLNMKIMPQHGFKLIGNFWVRDKERYAANYKGRQERDGYIK